MKKSRIIALLTAAMMIMSVIPAFADTREAAGGYFVDNEGIVYEKSGENMIANPGFEDGLTGLTQNSEYYALSQEHVHGGANSLKAIKSTKGDGAITAYFAVDDADASYYFSFWYKNTDSVARRPRVTFAFTDSSKTIPTVEDDFTAETNAWIGAGTATNDCDMEYSEGEWVKYSTVLKGNGNANACKYVALNIYGLTKNVSYVDDFELFELTYSKQYGDAFSKAVENWEKVSLPTGSLAGFGKINLPQNTGVDGVSVKWISSSEAIDAATGSYSSQAEETLAILTARLYVDGREDICYDFEYPYIVKSMFDPYVEWINTSVFASIGSAVSENLSLPASHEIEGYYPATITWSCSDEDVLSPNGEYTAPETTMYVDIIATIECNGEKTSVTKRVKALGGNLVDDGLIMYYDFEKPLGSKDTLYDNSQKENVYNATVEGITLVDGYAKFAGGASTITLPSNYATELTGSYSVSMWVNLDKSIATSGGMYRFFDFGGGTYTSQFLRYIPGTGQLSFMDRGTAESGSSWAIDTTVTDMAQNWRLVSFTYDKGTTSSVATIYIDGEQVATSGSNTTLTNSIYNIATGSSVTGFIGRTQWNNTDNPDYVGLMDDVRIYNRVITEDEIATLYSETRPTVTAPVTIKYVDLEGNKLKDDVTVSADVNTTYDVPTSYKSLPSSSDGHYRYVYKYLASQSTDSVYVSADGENVCKLVFKLEKQTKGTNIIENGNFEDGTSGWTNRLGTDITGATVEYDSTIGANVMKLATKGKSDTQNIGTVWNVEKGKDYTISFDIYANNVLDANNYSYNRLSDGYSIGDVGQKENSGSDIIAWGAELTAGSWVHFEKDFTAATDVVYFQSSWSNGDMKFANFILEEAGASDDGSDTDDTKIPVTIKYVDKDGNKLCEDKTVKVNKGVNDYTVPASYKSIEDKDENGYVYKYTFNAKETAGRDVVSISILRDNVATLVFDVLKADRNANLVVDGSFEDENGRFSWGTWQSPERQSYFKDDCSNWFYVVDRDTNSSVEYGSMLIDATDYALGTRWNDGTTGLCSMANFIPVEKGKTYIVSYDYKHSTAGSDASYISTSFVTTKTMGAGAASGSNIPQSVTSDWQTNTFTITAPSDGYIYFHFSYLGSGNGPGGSNSGNGPYWYFDNFEVLEVITFENSITYSAGYAEIVAEDGTEGYLVQATYDADGALVSVVISDKLTLSRDNVTRVEAVEGAKLMLVENLATLKPLAKAIIAE